MCSAPAELTFTPYSSQPSPNIYQAAMTTKAFLKTDIGPSVSLWQHQASGERVSSFMIVEEEESN